MIKYIVALAILFGLPATVLSQWQEVKNIPTQFKNNHWLEVFFLTEQSSFGWISGFNGMVLRTTDKGQTWKGVRIREADQIESIHFVSDKVGYAVSVKSANSGYSTLFKSIDGAATWTKVNIADSLEIWGCYFLNDNYGIVLGGDCNAHQLFYITQDGGKTWRLSRDSVKNSKLSDPILYQDGSGYAVSSGLLWKTNDFGKSWGIHREIKGKDWHEELAIHNNSLLVPFDFTCGGYGGNGGARFSRDGGNTWTNNEFGESCYGSFLLSDSSGWVCGNNRMVSFTENYGKTWTNKPCGIPHNRALDDLYFIDDTTGWVVGEGIFKYQPYDTLKPIISANKIRVCDGDYAVLTCDVEMPNYLWSTGATTRQISVSESGVYYLTAYSNECDSGKSNSITIVKFPKQNLLYNNNKKYDICEGDSAFVQLQSEISSVIWYDSSNATERYFKQNGWKYITIIDTNGCSIMDSVYINVVPYPIAKITPSIDTVLCVGRKLNIKSINSAYSVDWYDADNNTLIVKDQNSIDIDKSMSLYIIAKNVLGCADTSQIISYVIAFDTDNYEIVYSNQLNLLFIDSLYAQELSCRNISIKNKTDRLLYFRKAYLNSNTAFSMPQSQFPVRIEPFAIANIELCYSPTVLFKQKDTLTVYDICSNYQVFLEGYGKPRTYYSNTKCDLPIKLTTKILNSGAEFVSTIPYPNPAFSKVNIDYTIKYSEADAEQNVSPEFSLVDIMGITHKLYPLCNSEIRKENGKITEIGTYELDVSNIPAGAYLMIMSIEGEIQSSRVLLYK